MPRATGTVSVATVSNSVASGAILLIIGALFTCARTIPGDVDSLKRDVASHTTLLSESKQDQASDEARLRVVEYRMAVTLTMLDRIDKREGGSGAPQELLEELRRELHGGPTR